MGMGSNGPAAVAGSARQIGIGRAAHALAGHQQRHRLEQVGFARAVGADQHLRLGADLDGGMRIIAEVVERQPLYPKHGAVLCLVAAAPLGVQRHR